MLRRTLEIPAATAALVTPDRELARRVAAELRRWDIDIDDFAGLPLNRTPPGAFLRLVLDAAESGLAPVPLLAVLKHPLAAGAGRRSGSASARGVSKIESAGRARRPASRGVREAIDPKDEFVASLHQSSRALPGRLGRMLDARPRDNRRNRGGAYRGGGAACRERGRERHRPAVAGFGRRSGGAVLSQLIDAASDFPPIAARHYPAVFEALASGIVVRPAFGRHPRLAIWGLVEARLQQADLVVLGGLNEGTWPGPAAFDPWMSRQMREEFGIAVPERAIGIAAHDFMQAIGAPELALTRATRREGVPTIPSRWLLRLDAVLRATGLEGALAPEPEIEDAVALLDLPERRRPLPPVAPRPPVKARPRELPVTQIEMWMRDPYAVYARYILRLRALDELDAEPGAAELGTTVHDALAVFVKAIPARPAARSRSGADRHRTRMLRAALVAARSLGLLVAALSADRALVRRTGDAAPRGYRRQHQRDKGKLAIAAPAGPFTVTAIADRIDACARAGRDPRLQDRLVPSKPEIENGIAVQLPLEGAIARAGGFEGIAGIPAALEYWRLSGGEPAGERKALGEDDPQALIDRTRQRFASSSRGSTIRRRRICRCRSCVEAALFRLPASRTPRRRP